jgi:drug/metabolite transporter (DMT)-like permease
VLALALSLASSLSWGISDFMGGLQSRKMHVLVVVLLTEAVGLALGLLALPVLSGHSMSAGDLLLAAAGGMAGAVGLIGFYGAMSIGTIAVVTPIAGMGVVVPVAVGLARGEQPAAVQLVGVAVAMTAVALVSYESDEERRSVELRAVALAVAAALGFGIFFVAVDATASIDAANTIAAVRAGGVAAALVAVAIVRPSFAGTRAALPVIAAIGFFDFLANALFAVASTKGLLSVVAVGGSLYPAVTIVLAYFVLGDRLTRLRRFGVALALAGIVMIAAGT